MPKKLTLENHLTKEQLRRKYLSCQHSQEKKRWQGLTLIAEGGVAAQVAKQLGMSANWISETVHRYNAGGAGGVKNKSRNAGFKTLTVEQAEELEKQIESGGGGGGGGRLWSSTEIGRWVADKTGRRIHKTTAWRMFAKLDFTRQVPRPAHRKRASGQQQAEFKKS
jgi:transposase